MNAKAYVLISTAAEKTGSVVQALRAMPGVMAADLVTGPYDVVAVVQGADANAVGKLILNDIRGLAGISSTLTCLCIETS
jgi:DNA-binding Lrp family transcriptional regulator